MNSERNPHLLSDPSGGGGGCVLGSGTPGPLHGYGSPPGSHGGGSGGGGGVDMAAVGPPCPVPTPPWVKPPGNNGSSGMMTPESDVSSCSSPASTSYGASSTSFPQQTAAQLHQHQQQRAFYASNSNYGGCANNGNTSGGGDPSGASSGAVVHPMNAMQTRANHSGSYCSTPNSNSNAISSSTNSGNNNSGMFYDATGEVINQSQYYHHHHQQQQHHFQQQFSNNAMHNLHHQQQQKAGSCNSPSLDTNLPGDCVGAGGGGDNSAAGQGSASGQNFYAFYNSNQSGQYTEYHHQQQQQHHLNPHQQHHHDGGYGHSHGASGDLTGGRMHQYYRQDGGNSASANSVPVGHTNYFGGPTAAAATANNANYPASGDSTPPTRYGSPMMFPNNLNNNYGSQQQQQQQQHLQGQIPLRRNSIESYSSEPGDMHSSYSARYASCGGGGGGANNTVNVMNHPSANTMQMSNQQNPHHNNNPFTGSVVSNSGMVKRECSGMASRGSPSINPMTPNSNVNVGNTGCWSPHPSQNNAAAAGGGSGYFVSSPPSHSCGSNSSSPNPCSSNVATAAAAARTNFMNQGNTSYNQQTLCTTGESGNCANNFYQQQQHHGSHHHQQQAPTQFKSCAYEQSQQHHDIKEGISSMVANAGNSMKAASAVKHRSLSLSMPLPSYLEENDSSRPDLVESNFHRQMSHHQNMSHQSQLHNNNHHSHSTYNPMMDSSPHPNHNHNHQQCSTSGLVAPPDQSLLTPNSDDDIPFRAASAGGQSDLDSSYETMGDEGCSSTSTSVASHCMSSTMNTSGSSACSGENNPNGSVNTTTNHNMHALTIMDTTNDADCHHHHHHNHHHHTNALSFPSSHVVSSCMQNQHHHIATTMAMGILELPNSTVSLCTNNVDDLDESSTDSSVALHNAISAVVENSSIETPENTMMGDEDDDMGVEPVVSAGEIPSESGLHHHHHFQNQDSQTNVNIISTTTIEPDEVDGDDDDGDDVVDDDDDVADNCSESSMSHINSSFTADMFCNPSSNDVGVDDDDDDDDGLDDDNSNNLIMSSETDTSAAITSNNNNNNNEDNDKLDAEIIINSSSNNHYSAIPHPENSSFDEHIKDDGIASLNLHTFNNRSSTSPASLPPTLQVTDCSALFPTTSSSTSSSSSQSTVSPQKISKRSFSETDKDKVAPNATSTTSSLLSFSCSTTIASSSSSSTILDSFGASFGRNKSVISGAVNNNDDSGSSATSCSSESVNNNGNNNEGNNCVIASNIEEDAVSREGGGGGGSDNPEKSKNVDVTVNCGSNTNINNSNSTNTTANNGINNNNNNGGNNGDSNNSGTISGCKALDIIIRSGGSASCGNNIGVSDSDSNAVSIPKGWKREILKGSSAENGTANNNTTSGVLYISPSDTKIRNLDELKNYIGSDGTCKCGLSCPLRLEVAFSFDPKVTNMTGEDEKENLETLHAAAASASSSSTLKVTASVSTTIASGRNDRDTSTTSTSSTSVESDARLLCNHKRKIPKAEDSPLISSTRDDLGDYGEKLKKRRLSGNECFGEKLVSSGPFRKDPITTSVSNNASNNAISPGGTGGTNNGSSSSGSSNTGNNASHNVPVPFCQQSPDTTTQTPQTEMSPASSVCSDSSAILFSSAGSSSSSSGGNRSLTSTPTPTLSSSSTSSSISSASASTTPPTAASSTAAAAPPPPTTKIGSSPSQGQGHCEFVWPSPPPTLNQATSGSGNLSSGFPQLSQHQSTGTFWLNANNSLTTFGTNPSNSNSLTLNYVQSPGNNVTNIGSCAPSPAINNIVISSPTSNAAPVSSGVALSSTPTTSSTTTSTAATSFATTNSTIPQAAKKGYSPFPNKTVKRPSSPCPNIDVRQLPLEQNRPPPITSIVSATANATNANPILPNKTLPTISPAVSGPPNVTASPISSLTTLPMVTNPNILFTVTPPLMTGNKTEIVSLSAPTLPILPLLTTSGKLDTTCGPPTIVTTLQPSTNLFGTIDTSVFPSTALKKKVDSVTNILPSTSKPSVVSSSPQTQKAEVASSRVDPTKKKSEKEKEIAPATKSATKDGKEKVTVNSSGGETKSPLQLAQDIVNRFEKKSGEKKVVDNKSIGKSNESEKNSVNPSTTAAATATSTTTPLRESKEEKVVKDRVKVGAGKGAKDEAKQSGASAAVTVTKVDSSSSSSELQQMGANKADIVIIGSSTNAKSDTKNSNNEPETSKSSAGDAKCKATPEIVVIHDSSVEKNKLHVESLSKQPQQITSFAPTPPTSITVTFTNASGTLPVNTVVASSHHQPQLAHQQTLQDNTIITSQTPLILKDGLQLATDQGLTLTTSVSGPIPTISLSAMGNQLIQTSGAPVPCSTTLTGSLGTFAPATTNQIILQAPHGSHDQGHGANSTFLTTSAGNPVTTPLRYPILQTIQPLFLNSAGHAGGPLIISQPTQQQDHTQGNTLAQPSFIYDQNGTPTATIDTSGVGAFQSMLQPTTTTMVLDPSICAGNANLGAAGGKKKKKRLSKKQQQQQAQLQLQQQLILQQIQAQQQQAAAAAIAPLTIFPQSFNLGPQGFSLQPTMNFFPTPTILTLPNLILNPADGTLFIQPSTPLPTATTAPMQQTTMKLGQFPLTTTTTIPQNPQNIAPKKDGNGPTILQNITEIKPSSTPGLDSGSDDSRQNPTPDSSTNDLQLGLINVAGPTPQANTITLNIPAPTTTTVLHTTHTHSPVMSKKNSKSRTVSSSSTTVKRILPQKQILPKIDSTTPSTTENAN